MKRNGILAASALVLLGTSGSALAAEPPNQNDPCGTRGENTCGTNGVGQYTRYRYGTRWFGDFRGAVAGEKQTFCIDLRFWYPSKKYEYERFEGGAGLKNRAGANVPIVAQQKMAYVLWNYGRSDTKATQAAVMLYTHGQMGDGAPGEVDPKALGAGIAGLYSRIDAEATKLHGPYKISAEVPDNLTVATRTTAKLRVLSATGAAVPNVALSLKATGADGVPATVRTNGKGTASVALTPNDVAKGLTLDVEAAAVASDLPSFYRPSLPAPRVNGQRLAAPASQRLNESVTRTVAKTAVKISTTATPATLLVGESSNDKVKIRGLAAGRATPITVNLFGPFRATSDIRCEGTPAATSVLNAKGPGDLVTTPAVLAKPGIYTYQLSAPGDDSYDAVTTICGVPAETIRVEVQPKVRTVVTSPAIRPGSSISDKLTVEGLVGEPVTVNVNLYGPFASAAAIKCDVAPVWTGTVAVPADGDYLTAPTVLTTPGYYVYRETIAAGGFVRAAETSCNDAAETAISIGTPKVLTQVSAQQTTPGSSVTDSISVTGLGVVAATINVELWGPYPTREAISCSGTPGWTGTVAAAGDGTYTTAPVPLTTAGYYTYRETIAGSPANDAAATACSEATETTFAKATPKVTTLVSSDVVKPGDKLSDKIKVTGLGKTPVTIDVQLFGPFATKAAIRCNVAPFWTGQVAATGDGEVRSAEAPVTTAGFYTYRETIAGSPTVDEAATTCGETAETAVVAPEIHTGRGDQARPVRVQTAEGPAPTRVRVPKLNIDAPVDSAGIDTTKGLLAVPVNISRLGWWVDGASPVDATGTVLIAGHVDSARVGRGAFFRLKDARAGDRIEVITGGKTVAYKVQSLRSIVKKAIPATVYSQRLGKRLVLVTCGGPFDTNAGSYQNNIIITAVQA